MKNIRIFMTSIILIIAITALGGCSAAGREKITTYEQLDGKKVATTAIDTLLNTLIEGKNINPIPMYMNTQTDVVQAVLSNKASALLFDAYTASIYLKQNDKLMSLGVYGIADWTFITNLDNQKLLDEFNPIFDRMREDGTIAKLENKWGIDENSETSLEELEFTGEKGTLKIAVSGDYQGYCYVKNNEIVGSDIEIIRLACAEIGYIPEYVQVAEDALVTAIRAGKADISAVDMSESEEKAEQVAFFAPLYRSELVALVLK